MPQPRASTPRPRHHTTMRNDAINPGKLRKNAYGNSGKKPQAVRHNNHKTPLPTASTFQSPGANNFQSSVQAIINSIIQKWYYGSKPLEYPKMQAMMEPDLLALVGAVIELRPRCYACNGIARVVRLDNGWETRCLECPAFEFKTDFMVFP